MSTIIVTKYNQPCRKCGGQIKAGSLVNWQRGHGIWHLNKHDNEALDFSISDSNQMENSYCPEVDHREEEVVSSNDNDGTIEYPSPSIDKAIEILQQLTQLGQNVAASARARQEEVPVVIPSTPSRFTSILKKQEKQGRWERPLTSKQISFCELMALGSNRADAYTNSYDVTNPAFSNNAARKMLEQEKIRNKIAELRGDLDGDAHGDKEQAFFDAIKSEGAAGGWAFKLTENQEKFCQARASGATIVGAFEKSGYVTTNWTERRIRREANRLMKLPKVKVRIANLTSGNTLDIEPVVAGEHSHKTPRPLVPAEESVERIVGSGFASRHQSHQVEDIPVEDNSFVEAGQQPEVNEQPSVTNDEAVGSLPIPQIVFVDNFTELIKTHGRLVHYAIVARGQKEVGMPGSNVEEMEEAVYDSIERMRKDLIQQLI